MKSIEKKKISIPITRSSSDNTFINGILYGEGNAAIVFSNMDTNDQGEWDPILEALASDKYMMFTYDYDEHRDDQSETLETAVSYVRDLGAEKIVLVGASRGGVASLKVAARNTNCDSIAGVVALAAPVEYEGIVFYSEDELSGIKIPKLLINSENDGGANDNRKMIEIFGDPKELLLYPGSAHGTELFDYEQESIAKKLREFAGFVFGISQNAGASHVLSEL